MKAAVQDRLGDPSVLVYADHPEPVCGPTTVLIDVAAVSIEGGDTLHRRFGPLGAVPHVVGYQAAGTVLEVGSDVSGFAVGDAVVTLGLDGSHAARRAADQRATWKLPAGLDLQLGACVPVPAATAHDCLFEFGRLQSGETVLIHAGAGGVGIAAIQLAHQAGAVVCATASSEERLARLAEFGLDHGIDYTKVNFADALRELTTGRGADLIVDSIGGPTLQASLSALAYRGRCVTVGDAGRADEMTFDLSGLRPSNQSLTGYFLGAELFFTPRPYPLIASLLEDVAAGRLRVVVDRTFPLSEAAAAHTYIESRQAFGRVLLIP